MHRKLYLSLPRIGILGLPSPNCMLRLQFWDGALLPPAVLGWHLLTCNILPPDVRWHLLTCNILPPDLRWHLLTLKMVFTGRFAIAPSHLENLFTGKVAMASSHLEFFFPADLARHLLTCEFFFPADLAWHLPGLPNAPKNKNDQAKIQIQTEIIETTMKSASPQTKISYSIQSIQILLKNHEMV